MKSVKIILKIAAAFAVLAGVLFVIAAFWDKLTALYERRGEFTEKAKEKLPTKEQIRAKLPTKKAIFDKLPTKADMIRLNPFRKAEIEAEYADYLIAQLEGEKRRVLLQQRQEDPVPFPLRQIGNPAAGDPRQFALGAGHELAFKTVGGEQVHVLPFPPIRHEGDDPAIAPARQAQPGLLAHLAQKTVIRTLVRLHLAADADPFDLILVVLLRGPVQHQHLIPAEDIA